jgi:rRNA pseudouridine-1189 N-methylase Emg1 (Nep1/Mra1 family)
MNRRKLVSNVRVLEKRTTSRIPYKYNEFKKLFKKELEKEALPKH